MPLVANKLLSDKNFAMKGTCTIVLATLTSFDFTDLPYEPRSVFDEPTDVANYQDLWNVANAVINSCIGPWLQQTSQPANLSGQLRPYETEKRYQNPDPDVGFVVTAGYSSAGKSKSRYKYFFTSNATFRPSFQVQ